MPGNGVGDKEDNVTGAGGGGKEDNVPGRELVYYVAGRQGGQHGVREDSWQQNRPYFSNKIGHVSVSQMY